MSKTFFWFLMFFSINLFAQDSLYVKKQSEILSLRLFDFSDLFFLTDYSRNLNYLPSINAGIGLGIYCKYIPFDFNYRYVFGHDVQNEYEKYSSTNMMLRSYSKIFAGDIYIQKFKGFKIIDKQFMHLIPIEEDNKEYEYHPDVEMFNYSMVGQYIFNGQKFSMKAGFTQYENQLQSSGSFLCGAELNYLKISSDSSMFFGQTNQLNSFSIGLNAGYGYNFVFKKHFLLFAYGASGINFGNERFAKLFNRNTYLSPLIHLKGAFWYRKDQWSFGATALWNANMLTFNEEYNIYLHSARIEVMAIRRLWNPKK